MASYRKVAAGWRVEIQRRGVRKSRTFQTKAAGAAWAMQEERAIIDGEVSRWPRKTVRDACDRYAQEISATKRTTHAEHLRLARFVRDCGFAARLLCEVTPSDVAAWRDQRLQLVTSGSVRREITLLRHIWTVAIRQWQWCPDNPWSRIQVPDDNPARDRLIGWREIRRLLRRCGYRTGVPPQTGQEFVAYAFLLALRTAMRAGEVMGLTGAAVDLERRVITLARHKTMEQVGKRQVPVTPQALRVLRVLWREGPLFLISAATLDALFRKLRDQVMLSDIHFHDSRATALTHLAAKVDVMVLARISGHKDISLLHRVYFRTTTEQISAQLAAPRR